MLQDSVLALLGAPGAQLRRPRQKKRPGSLDYGVGSLDFHFLVEIKLGFQSNPPPPQKKKKSDSLLPRGQQQPRSCRRERAERAQRRLHAGDNQTQRLTQLEFLCSVGAQGSPFTSSGVFLDTCAGVCDPCSCEWSFRVKVGLECLQFCIFLAKHKLSIVVVLWHCSCLGKDLRSAQFIHSYRPSEGKFIRNAAGGQG